MGDRTTPPRASRLRPPTNVRGSSSVASTTERPRKRASVGPHHPPTSRLSPPGVRTRSSRLLPPLVRMSATAPCEATPVDNGPSKRLEPDEVTTEQPAAGDTFVIDDLTEAHTNGRTDDELPPNASDAEEQEEAGVKSRNLSGSLSNFTFDLASSCNSELPPNSPGSSLSKSLKFLEASHLLSDEEMIQMGCQPPSRNVSQMLPPPDITLDLSNASSLLTESLLNVSLNKEEQRVITSTCVKAQMSAQPARRVAHDSGDSGPEPAAVKESATSEPGLLFTDISASPIHHETVDEQGEEHSEINNATFSLTSHDLDSLGGTSLEASLNESELCSESVPPGASCDMEILDKLSEHSISEADLTMRDEEAVESGSEVNPLAPAAGGVKKKRTRSPTPSSVKTESIPAKRSLTLQRSRPTPAAGRPASATATTPRRKSSVAASNTSLADKSAPGASGQPAGRRSTAATLKKASAVAPADSVARRSSAATAGARGVGGMAASQPGTASARAARRSVGGSSSDVSGGDFKKPLPRGSITSTTSASRGSAASSAAARRDKSASTLAAPRTSIDGTAGVTRRTPGTAAAAAASSRLKAPSLLQRTFSRKSSGPPAPAAAAAGTPRGGAGARGGAVGNSVSNLSTVTASSAANLQRKKDSQLNPRSPGPKPNGRTAQVSHSGSSTERQAPVKQQGDARPKTAPLLYSAKGRQHLSSNSSDVKSSSKCSTPEPDFRELMAAQTAELTAQEARLSDLTLRCSEKEKSLAEGQSRLQRAVHSFTVMAAVCQTLNRHAEEAERRNSDVDRRLHEVIVQTKHVSSQCELLIQEKSALKLEMAKEAEAFRQRISEMTTSHRLMLQNERTKLLGEKEVAISQVIDQHSAEVKTLKNFHGKELDRMRLSFESMIDDLKEKHTSNLDEISMRDEKHLQELQNQHEKKIAEITRRFEDMKVTLSDRIQVLHVECNELRSKTYQHDESVRRNSDYKLQRSESVSDYGALSHSSASMRPDDQTMNGRFGLASSEAAIQQFQHLPEENASLKAVLDLRINENAELRRQNTELQAKISDLEEIRVKNDQLHRQNENLEAIISLKTDNEKQLQERHHSLMRRYDRESKEKKRLSMGYEELLYKLEECQSHEDLTKRSLSDIPSMTSSAVVMRSTPASNASRPRHRGLQHDRSKRKTIASSRELD